MRTIWLRHLEDGAAAVLVAHAGMGGAALHRQGEAAHALARGDDLVAVAAGLHDQRSTCGPRGFLDAGARGRAADFFLGDEQEGDGQLGASCPGGSGGAARSRRCSRRPSCRRCRGRRCCRPPGGSSAPSRSSRCGWTVSRWARTRMPLPSPRAPFGRGLALRGCRRSRRGPAFAPASRPRSRNWPSTLSTITLTAFASWLGLSIVDPLDDAARGPRRRRSWARSSCSRRPLSSVLCAQIGSQVKYSGERFRSVK